MQKEGRPQAGGHGIAAVRYTTRWSRSDDGRTGTFVSYTLKLNSAAAIWWESDTDAVACFVFGPAGSDADLLRMYLEHHFVVA